MARWQKLFVLISVFVLQINGFGSEHNETYEDVDVVTFYLNTPYDFMFEVESAIDETYQFATNHMMWIFENQIAYKGSPPSSVCADQVMDDVSKHFNEKFDFILQSLLLSRSQDLNELEKWKTSFEDKTTDLKTEIDTLIDVCGQFDEECIAKGTEIAQFKVIKFIQEARQITSTVYDLNIQNQKKAEQLARIFDDMIVKAKILLYERISQC